VTRGGELKKSKRGEKPDFEKLGTRSGKKLGWKTGNYRCTPVEEGGGGRSNPITTPNRSEKTSETKNRYKVPTAKRK